MIVNMHNGWDVHFQDPAKAQEIAWKVGNRIYFSIQESDEGYDYTMYDENFRLADGGRIDDNTICIMKAAEQVLESFGLQDFPRIPVSYEWLAEKAGS